MSNRPSRYKKLSNVEDFNPSAQCFREKGTFTEELPNSHPNSSFMKFWRRERERSLKGHNMGHDFIPGFYYWYLNYCPIERIVEEEGEASANEEYDFPAIYDGDYDFYHYIEEAMLSGEHADVLKARRKGYSWKAASMLDRNYFLIPNSKNYALAYFKEYLTGDGILSKAWSIMNFIDENTPWAKKRHYKDSLLHKRASYGQVTGGIELEKGYKSDIIGVSMKDNPGKARGKSADLIIFEEAGKFPGLLTTWQIMRPSVEQGKYTTGLLLAFGTGGEEDADFSSAEEMFYNPKGYKIHAVDNEWEDNAINNKVSYFVPAYMNYEGFIDKNGNSDVDSAIEEINKEIENIQANSTDVNAVERRKAELPIKPSHATLRTSGTLFPVMDLKETLSKVLTNPGKYIDINYIGNLVLDEEKGVKWKPDNTLRPIREFPLKSTTDVSGCIEIFEQPVKGENGFIPYGRYILGVDVVDDDGQEGSLQSCFVFDRLKNRIVAEYTGRPVKASTFYENVRRLSLYYNGIINYENNKKGLYQYFSNKRCVHLICDVPEKLKDRDMIQSSTTGNKSKGTPANQYINRYARRLIDEWLRSDDLNSEDMMNLHKIRSVGLLRELIAWNPKDNFDRVSALGMVMLIKDELEHLEVEEEENIRSKSQDPFFERNFSGGVNSSGIPSSLRHDNKIKLTN